MAPPSLGTDCPDFSVTLAGEEIAPFNVALLRGCRRQLASPEYQNLALGLLLGYILRGQEVDDVVEQDKSNQNAYVAPLVAVAVLVQRVDVRVAVDKVLSNDGPDRRAGPV